MIGGRQYQPSKDAAHWAALPASAGDSPSKADSARPAPRTFEAHLQRSISGEVLIIAAADCPCNRFIGASCRTSVDLPGRARVQIFWPGRWPCRSWVKEPAQLRREQDYDRAAELSRIEEPAQEARSELGAKPRQCDRHALLHRHVRSRAGASSRLRRGGQLHTEGAAQSSGDAAAGSRHLTSTTSYLKCSATVALTGDGAGVSSNLLIIARSAGSDIIQRQLKGVGRRNLARPGHGRAARRFLNRIVDHLHLYALVEEIRHRRRSSSRAHLYQPGRDSLSIRRVDHFPLEEATNQFVRVNSTPD